MGGSAENEYRTKRYWQMLILRWLKQMIYTAQELVLIRDSFIPAFTVLKDTLVKKLLEADGNWERM